ncbi:alcohol dehydrogenase catalytic domain-containing protein [Lentzea sp. NPDC059081]|uniref:alcohol dehydrogenase catalytic domain-containing protein n=1 Tax=Lentzea sp. NPDC059081 TaxID=3346719 RepID=UPI00367C8435
MKHPTDVVVRVVASAICESDVRYYRGLEGPAQRQPCGHEFIGVVADIGSEIVGVRRGDMVVAPLAFADGTCGDCARGRHDLCAAGGLFGVAGDGGQAEGVRVPFGDATLVKVPMGEHDERLPSVLALGDVMAAGWHAVSSTRVGPGSVVAVVSDDADGLCAVLAARCAGAERIILVTTSGKRAAIGERFGATDIVVPDGEAFRIRRPGGRAGADVVIDCGGDERALSTTLAACRDGGVVSLGASAHLGAGGISRIPDSGRGLTIVGGPAPARAYLPGLLANVVAGRLDPSPIFDHAVPLALVSDGYEAMSTRAAVKVLVTT